MSEHFAFDDRVDQSSATVEENTVPTQAIREELSRILASRHFRTSRRGKEFLQYVVDQKLSGKGDLLKERLIGVNLFGRKPDYGTGEDPVVRVQAGDVRRRLESYNADPEVGSEVMIQIPVGSYGPVFVSRKAVHGSDALPETSLPLTHSSVQDAETAPSETTENHPSVLAGVGPHPKGVVFAPESQGRPIEPPYNHAGTRGNGRETKLWAAIAVLVFAALTAYLVTSHIHRSPEGTLKAFWAPAAVSAKPVLICLPRPIVYRPSEKLYDRYAETHPNAFSTRESRRDQILPLEPTDTVKWGDMTPVRNSGPGIGAVVAAVNIGKLLAEQGIRSELRFGEEGTYADMRDSPVVLVGGINTEWSTQLTSESAFVFDESLTSPNIHEIAGAKRVWKMESRDGNITRDFGLITRQSSGKAGQFLVQVAGISHFGTEAASEFLANKKQFSAELRARSITLQEKNLQVVVSTEVTAGRAGPPHVEALSTW